MHLQHFEKLKRQVKALIEQHRELRFRNYQLEQEVLELKERLKAAEKNKQIDALQELKTLQQENEALKAERDALKERLKHLIAELEQIDIV